MDNSTYFDGKGTEYPILETLWFRVKAVGDKMDRAIKTGYCGECECHKQTISELQNENKQLEYQLYINDKIFTATIHDVSKKLEAIRDKLGFTPSYLSVEEFSREIMEILDDE